MDEALTRAVAAAARAFAEVLEQSLLEAKPIQHSDGAPAPGTTESMVEILQSVGRINHDENRGVTDAEMRVIAARAGIDPRGMAGYYSPAVNLLEKRGDGTRWLTDTGEERLAALLELLRLSSNPAE